MLCIVFAMQASVCTGFSNLHVLFGDLTWLAIVGYLFNVIENLAFRNRSDVP